MVKARQAMFAMAFLLPAGIFAQGLVGTFTSSASVFIGDAEMRATAAASWPVVDGDEIAATKAPALLTTTPDRNLVTFERESKARIKTVENRQAFVYLRQGGVLFDTKARHLYICVANRLFITDTGSKGVLRLEKWGSVTRTLLAGSLLEQGEHACNAQASTPLVTGLSSAPGGAAASAGAGSAGVGGAGAGGVGAGAGAGAGSTAGGVGAGAAAAGGTATAPAAAAAAGAGVGGVGAGTIGIAAGAVGAGSATAAGLTGAFTNSCSTPGGCSNLPLAVSPSSP